MFPKHDTLFIHQYLLIINIYIYKQFNFWLQTSSAIYLTLAKSMLKLPLNYPIQLFPLSVDCFALVRFVWVTTLLTLYLLPFSLSKPIHCYCADGLYPP